MANYNKVILVGNLTRDPELKYLPSGSAVCEFSIAYNERFKKGTGEAQEKVHFFDIVAWKQTAENVSKYLKKGNPCLVEGTLSQDRWEAPDGQKRSRIKVQAQRVVFLGGKPQGQEGEAAAPGADEDVPF